MNPLKGEAPQGFWKLGRKTDQCTIDGNGNLIRDDQKIYTWDGLNRLIQVSYINPQPVTVADTIQMSYDGLGRRVGITELHSGTVLTAKTFVWCEGQLCQERDVTGKTVTKRFFVQGEQISGVNYYYTKDHLGSVREMTDSSGNVQGEYGYNPYGRQVQLGGTMTADFGYTGFYQERAANLDLTWFRAYDAEKGRWLSRDPGGESAGINLFAYVINNTMGKVDTLGLLPSWSEPVVEGGVQALTEKVASESISSGIGCLAGIGLQLSGVVPFDPFAVYLGALTDIGLMAAGVAAAPAIGIAIIVGVAYSWFNESGKEYENQINLAHPPSTGSSCNCR